MTWSAGTSASPSTSTASGSLTPRVGLERRTPLATCPQRRSPIPPIPPSPHGFALFLVAAHPQACLTRLIRSGTEVAVGWRGRGLVDVSVLIMGRVGRGSSGGEGETRRKTQLLHVPSCVITFHSPPASPPLSLRYRCSDTSHALSRAAGARVHSKPRAQAQGRAVCHTATTSTMPALAIDFASCSTRAWTPSLSRPRAQLPTFSFTVVRVPQAQPLLLLLPLSPPGKDPIPAHAGRHGWCSGRGR
ncbi:hypothetical protein B0H13DRAFT_709794 [Mycena leptocephala]|nr:hypothetical protein B0H13DRAFT_709794 [Mycena leptocephala]